MKTNLCWGKVRHIKGFTLVELMIVVAIVAILAAIAYPSYAESVRKGRRAEARAALTELLQQQERFMTQNNTYRAFAAGATGVSFITRKTNVLTRWIIITDWKRFAKHVWI